MAKILIVDDEQANIDMIKRYGEHLGYDLVGISESSLVETEIKRENYDLIILDVMMPNIDGFELLKRIKSVTQVKVVFLSARTDVKSRIEGLKLGAVDYMIKPFSLEELFLKIGNLIDIDKSHKYKYDDYILDIVTKSVTKEDLELNMSPILFDLFYVLISNKGKILTREYLLEEVWGTKPEFASRTLDTHILKLRTILGNDGGRIKTVRSKGYMYEN